MSEQNPISNGAQETLKDLDQMKKSGVDARKLLDYATRQLEELVWGSRARQNPTVLVGRALEAAASSVLDPEAQLTLRKQTLAIASSGVQAAPGLVLAETAAQLAGAIPERDRLRLNKKILKSISKTSKGKVRTIAGKAHEALSKKNLPTKRALAIADRAFEKLIKSA